MGGSLLSYFGSKITKHQEPITRFSLLVKYVHSQRKGSTLSLPALVSFCIVFLRASCVGTQVCLYPCSIRSQCKKKSRGLWSSLPNSTLAMSPCRVLWGGDWKDNRKIKIFCYCTGKNIYCPCLLMVLSVHLFPLYISMHHWWSRETWMLKTMK